MPGFVNDITSAIASAIRLPRGRARASGLDGRKEPVKLLELWDFEACPYCRKVRETLSELDLDHVVHSVPRGSPKREELRRLGGKVQVPYLVDPNTGTSLYESDDIVDYLERTYGSSANH